jgi:hypothetical protein
MSSLLELLNLPFHLVQKFVEEGIHLFGIDQSHPQGSGAAPRRKPRGKPHPPQKTQPTTLPSHTGGLWSKTPFWACASIKS